MQLLSQLLTYLYIYFR